MNNLARHSISGNLLFCICHVLIFAFWGARFFLAGYRLSDYQLEANIFYGYAVLLAVLGIVACRRSKHWFDFFTVVSALIVSLSVFLQVMVGSMISIDWTAEPVIKTLKTPSGRLWFMLIDTEECQNRLVASRYVWDGHAIQFTTLTSVKRLDAPAIYLSDGNTKLVFESLGDASTRRLFSTDWPCTELPSEKQ